MIFDLLAPPPSPRGWGQKKCAVARLIHVTNSHTKFGWISSNGLGGDSVRDRRTDGGDCNIPDAFLKKRGDNKPIKQTKTVVSTLTMALIWVKGKLGQALLTLLSICCCTVRAKSDTRLYVKYVANSLKYYS